MTAHAVSCLVGIVVILALAPIGDRRAGICMLALLIAFVVFLAAPESKPKE